RSLRPRLPLAPVIRTVRGPSSAGSSSPSSGSTIGKPADSAKRWGRSSSRVSSGLMVLLLFDRGRGGASRAGSRPFYGYGPRDTAPNPGVPEDSRTTGARPMTLSGPRPHPRLDHGDHSP